MVSEAMSRGMGSERPGRKSPSPTPQRRRLSDITNVPVPTNRTKTQDEMSKGSVAELQKEIVALRKTLEEKEKIIQAQTFNIEKLLFNYCQKTKQNQEIIQHNAQLYKDLMQARDRLKIAQHENALMAGLHKSSKSELQLKLSEALERANHLEASLERSTIEASSDKQRNLPNVLTKLVQSRARRTLNACETSGDSTLECSGKDTENSAENPIHCRTSLRRRESLSYKEPSLKVKLRQPDSEGGSCQIRRLSNAHEDVEGLQRVCEDQELSLVVSSLSSNSEAGVVEETSAPLSCSIPQPKENLTAPIATTSPKAAKARQTQSLSMTDPVHFSRRNSSERPTRRTVGSVASYREPPLNTKMRRPE